MKMGGVPASRAALPDRIRTHVWRALVFLVSLVEVPLFLLRNRAIFRNRILFPFFHWSFGHSVSGTDFASRLYWPHRISLLYVPHPNSNPLLPHLWEHNIDVFTLRSRLPFRSAEIDMVRFAVLRFFALVVAGLRMRHYVIERLQVYRTLSPVSGKLLAGRPDIDRVEEVIDYLGYVRLLGDGVGRNPTLPRNLLERCTAAIEVVYPEFFTRPFVSLVLRAKGQGQGLHTELRNAGPIEGYVPAVQWLTAHGFHVVPTGETGRAGLSDIPGVYDLDTCGLEPRLANLFALTRSALFIGQQSGAPVLANACGIPCLLTDAMPYRQGTYRPGDLVLYKRLRDREHGRVMSIVEVFRHHSDLAFGHGFERKGVDIESNTPDEILEAVQEAAAVARGELELSDLDRELCALFEQLLEPTMHIAWQGTRPTLGVLRRAERELRAQGASEASDAVLRVAGRR